VTLGENTEEYCSTVKCGMRSEAIPVIINGEKVREGSWPWHAALYYRPTTDTIKFRCGATIINERTLITIATCLVTFNAALQRRVDLEIDKLSVAVGETVLFDSSGTRQVHKVNKIKFHENFAKENIHDSFKAHRSYKDDYNVALILLDEDIRYSLHVAPICLPTDDEYDYDGKIGKVVGW
jgi:secreted trypsin-like serine protease